MPIYKGQQVSDKDASIIKAANDYANALILEHGLEKAKEIIRQKLIENGDEAYWGEKKSEEDHQHESK